MKSQLLRELAAGLLLLTLTSSAAQAAEPTDECGLCFATLADGERLVVPLESTEVRLDVQPGLVEAQVTQTFTNRTETALEATYLYPLPAGATLTEFELQFRDRVVRSVVREKAQAKVEYEQAKREGRKAALVQQLDPSLFSTAVANFLPGETVRTVLRFIQPVALSATAAEIRFPMTTGVKYFPPTAAAGETGNAAPTPPKVSAAAAAEHHYYAFDVLVNGFPASEISSSSHAIRIEEASEGKKRVGLAEEITIPDRDFLLRIENHTGTAPASTVVVQQVAGGSYGLFTVFPPQERPVATVQQPARDILFLIDRSNSMYGTRIASATLGLQGCLGMLEPKDRFQIVTFSDTYEFYRTQWTPATTAAVEVASTFAGTIRSSGGTMMQPALQASLEFCLANDPGREQLIVFLTDGDVGNEAELLRLLETNSGRVRLFTFGVGAVPNAGLLGKMAELGRGQARFISDDSSIARELSEFFTTLATPVLTDVKLTLLDAQGAELPTTLYPRVLGDVFMARPIQAVFAVEGSEPASVLLEAKRAGTPVSEWLPFSGRISRGDGVTKHFGRMRYEELAAQRRATAGSPQQEAIGKTMLETALRFQLVTEMTSRVAIDREVARAPKAVLQSKAVAQYAAAAKGAVIAGSDGEIIVLSPFSVDCSADTGYAAASTLAGSRLNTELRDVCSSISVVTEEFLKDLGSKRLEDAVPATGEPMENSMFARPGVDAGLIDGLPIATVIDPNTVNEITVQPAGPAWTALRQKQAAFWTRGIVEAGGGDGGAANAKVVVNATDGADRLAGLAIVSQGHDEHDRWSALVDGRARFNNQDLVAGAQLNQLNGYGRATLTKLAVLFGRGSDMQFRLSAAWHRLKRDDPMQFRRDSATGRYDGLGFFNLDVLTAPVREVQNRILQADLGGSMSKRHNWNVTTQWHRQTLGYVPTADSETIQIGRSSLQILGGDQVSLFESRLRLSAHGGWAQHNADNESGGAHSTAKWAAGAKWELNNTFDLFIDVGREETPAAVPGGEWRDAGGTRLSVALPPERRDSVQVGTRIGLLDERITGTVAFFEERVADAAFRDWAWEAAHPTPVAMADGGWISPIRHGVCTHLVRAGWRTEWNFQPLRNLTAILRWYEDWKNEGPITGGNHRGMCQLRYDFDHGRMKGFSVGGGFDYRNTVRFSDGVELAGGLNWNLLFGYERKVFGPEPTAVRLTLRNVGGNEYQPTRFANDRGRQVLLLVSQEF